MWLIKTFLTTAALQLKKHFKGTRLYALLICSELFCCTAGCLVILSSKAARQNISVAKGNCESVIPCIEQISFILRLLASSYISWLRGDVSLLTYSALAMLCFRRSGCPCQLDAEPVGCDRCWISALWLVARSHGASGRWSAVWHARPRSKNSTYEPSTPNFCNCARQSHDAEIFTGG